MPLPDISDNKSHINQQLLQQLIEKSERSRVSRKLHYNSASLSGVKLGLEILQATEKLSGDGERELNKILDFLGQASSDIRDMLSCYQPPEFMEAISFSDAVHRDCSRFKNDAIEVAVDTGFIPDVRCSQLKYNLFRIFQEVFSNAIKHSQGDKVLVTIDGDDQRLRLVVSDNGVGGVSWPSEEKGLEDSLSGLEIVSKRARLFGGAIILDSQPGKGTSLFVEVPLS